MCFSFSPLRVVGICRSKYPVAPDWLSDGSLKRDGSGSPASPQTECPVVDGSWWIAKSLCPLQREIVVICNVIWRSWWCSWTFFWVSILRRTPEESLSSMSSHGSPADPSLECPLTDGSPPDVLSSFDPCRDFEDVQDKVQMSVRKNDFKRHDFNPDRSQTDLRRRSLSSHFCSGWKWIMDTSDSSKESDDDGFFFFDEFFTV